MPNARARLWPTISITTAPTSARMICVWMTAGERRREHAGDRQADRGALHRRELRPEVERHRRHVLVAMVMVARLLGDDVHLRRDGADERREREGRDEGGDERAHRPRHPASARPAAIFSRSLLM